jgi:very-short-patch-repair endonuclease
MQFYDRTTHRVRGTPAAVEEAARALRQRMTPAERRLWRALRGHKLGGLQFRRQHPVGTFILDFYCPAAKLVVELDGGVHSQQLEHDQARTEQLNAFGYRVIRFRNSEVFTNLDSVLGRIRLAATSEP